MSARAAPIVIATTHAMPDCNNSLKVWGTAFQTILPKEAILMLNDAERFDRK
jgi:hypothetical protein